MCFILIYIYICKYHLCIYTCLQQYTHLCSFGLKHIPQQVVTPIPSASLVSPCGSSMVFRKQLWIVELFQWSYMVGSDPGKYCNGCLFYQIGLWPLVEVRGRVCLLVSHNSENFLGRKKVSPVVVIRVGCVFFSWSSRPRFAKHSNPFQHPPLECQKRFHKTLVLYYKLGGILTKMVIPRGILKHWPSFKNLCFCSKSPRLSTSSFRFRVLLFVGHTT